jgi:NitT/TauT family transport system permease protein
MTPEPVLARAPAGHDGNDPDGAVASAPAASTRARRRDLMGPKTDLAVGWMLLAIVALGSWEWAGRHGMISPIFFSYPSAIGRALMEGLEGDLLTLDARYTVIATVVGFVTAALAGIIVAFGLSQVAYLRKLLNPIFNALNSLPRVALAPLFVLWFGIGLLSHIVLAASLTFFVVFANTMAGIESVDQDHLLLARLQGARRWQTFRWFIVPSALPSIFVGLELGFIFAMLGTVSGEMIAGEAGFGVRLQRDAGVFNTKGYFATLLVLVLVSAIASGLFQLAKRPLVRWQSVHLLRRL